MEINVNLDGMNQDDLEEMEHTFTLLARYARHKRAAMIYRKQGFVSIARDQEKACDNIYKMLPESVRW